MKNSSSLLGKRIDFNRQHRRTQGSNPDQWSRTATVLQREGILQPNNGDLSIAPSAASLAIH